MVKLLKATDDELGLLEQRVKRNYAMGRITNETQTLLLKVLDLFGLLVESDPYAHADFFNQVENKFNELDAIIENEFE